MRISTPPGEDEYTPPTQSPLSLFLSFFPVHTTAQYPQKQMVAVPLKGASEPELQRVPRPWRARTLAMAVSL